MSISNKQLKEFLDFSRNIAYDAGDILMKYQKKRSQLKITCKGVEGIASEADEKAEELIMGNIRSTYPDHYILSEEDYSKQAEKDFEEAVKAEYAWLVDPLDGTSNFVNGIPIYCVSIGLISKGEPIVGVVYNPTSGECFYASKGNGAYLVDFRLNPFKKHKLFTQENTKSTKDCIFSPAPVYEEGSKFDRQLSVFRKNILPAGARAVRRLGSAALELCYVANGNFDAYWEKNLKPWDVAAAGIICIEANIGLTDFDGKAYTPFDQSILAAAHPLHEKILGHL
jgi:myo-inositol-1(or 4)-monophosphatase